MIHALTPRLLVNSIRIAANAAARETNPNPLYVEAVEKMATALEQAKVSVRADGNYWIVKIPIERLK